MECVSNHIFLNDCSNFSIDKVMAMIISTLRGYCTSYQKLIYLYSIQNNQQRFEK